MSKFKKKIFRNNGFTLIELLIVICIAGTLIAIASFNFGISRPQRLATMTKELHSDLQKARMDALTRSSNAASRGFGLRFPTGSSYRTFEFVDNADTGHTDFKYDDDSEEVDAEDKEVSSIFTINIGASGDPAAAGNELIFDKRGFARKGDWSLLSSRVYVLSMTGLTEKRCVSLSRTRIREGVWDGSSCDEN